MEIVKSEKLEYKIEMDLVKISPSNLSLFGSIALGYFHELTKEGNIENSEQALQWLYRDWNSVVDILKRAGLEDYLNIFTSFSRNLTQYKNFAECMKEPRYSEVMNSIYFFFAGLYSFHLNFQIFESLPYDVQVFSQHLEYFLSQIKAQVSIYKNQKIYKKLGGDFLNIEISEKGSCDYCIVVSVSSLVIHDGEASFLEKMFRYTSAPKKLSKLNKLIEIIYIYQRQFKKITPEMQSILEIREKWTCSHDIKTITLSCGKKHCLYCLYELVRNSGKGKSVCGCGVTLTNNEYDKIFKYVESNNRKMI